MGRMYSAPITIATSAADIDLLELIAATEKPIVVHQVVISTNDKGDAAEDSIPLEVARYAGTYTSGSGGDPATGIPLDQGGTADGATVETGNTTVAIIATGTKEIILSEYMNSRAGWVYLPTPEARVTVLGTDAFVVALTAAPAATTAYNGYVVYEELG